MVLKEVIETQNNPTPGNKIGFKRSDEQGPTKE